MNSTDWRPLFDPNEVRLYELFLDVDSDAWHIWELIQAAGLEKVPVDGKSIGSVLPAVLEALSLIESVMERNADVIPSVCWRPGRYPWIRQRRDVHQFDVGSHLACCCAMAVRNLGMTQSRNAGAVHLERLLGRRLRTAPSSLMPAAAIFHDMFKCFRPRRPLPGKLGPKVPIDWHADARETDEDEVQIALTILQEVMGAGELRGAVIGSLEASQEISSAMSEMRSGSRADAQYLANSFWKRHAGEDHYIDGLALYLADLESKGFIRDVPTERKGFRWSLSEVRSVLITSADEVLGRV